MHYRYQKEPIADIFSDENKTWLWQSTEVAVIEAMGYAGKISLKTATEVARILSEAPLVDLDWWKARDREIHHDLNAFIDERLRHLPPEYQEYLHKKITSFDTEEAAFATMLIQALQVVYQYADALEAVLVDLAKKYRYNIMMGMTHGQAAELQTFGKRCLTWLRDLRFSRGIVETAAKNLKYSKISGAIGNYGSIDPEVERIALELLGFVPYYGAKQIIPREIYAPLAQALCQLVASCNKIALDIRLGARSTRPIYQEPFGKKQKGSSAMPHKKNTILTEQIEGMLRMAKGYFGMIMDNITTWEERAIEQSCVERVAWPDLFHVTVHVLETMTKVLKNLVVYPDNMLLEVMETQGCYASSEAKELLKEMGKEHWTLAEESYRIVQLAAFNVFESRRREFFPNESLAQADEQLSWLMKNPPTVQWRSIQDIIIKGDLSVSPQLEATKEDVDRWNMILVIIFQQEENRERWGEIFSPSYLLKNENVLYREILGI